MKVRENTDPDQIASLFAGRNFEVPNWTLFGSRSVTLSEFEMLDHSEPFTYDFQFHFKDPLIF